MAAVQLSDAQFNQLLEKLKGAGGGAAGADGNGGSSTTDSTSKSAKPPSRPIVDIDTTDGEWAIFDDQWSRYKRMAKLTALDDIRDNLRQCCGPSLNKRLFDLKGPAVLNSATEEDLLLWIKQIAVKGAHMEVHRNNFVQLKQKQGETINSYLGRLKASARLCEFKQAAPESCSNNDCNCPNHGVRVSYEDDQVSTQLVAGLYNTDHQARILSETTSLKTLDQKLQRLVSLEKSETAMSSLNGQVVNSNYTGGTNRRNERQNHSGERGRSRTPVRGGRGGRNDSRGRSNNRTHTPNSRTHTPNSRAHTPNSRNNIDNNENCLECGRRHPQCAVCNGFHKCTTKCNSCQAMGHIRNCCPLNSNAVTAAADDASSRNVRHEAHTDEESIVFQFHIQSEEQIITSELNNSNSLMISTELITHMEWMNDKFERMKPQDAPFLKVSCKLMITAHINYGRKCTPETSEGAEVSGLADTGAQICTAGTDFLVTMGIDLNFLIPTRMSVKGVCQSKVSVLGALFLQISAGGRTTQQLVYIANGARVLILSEKALMDLGVLPENFPSAGMFGPQSQTQKLQINLDLNDHEHASIYEVKEVRDRAKAIVKSECGCPLRTDVPELPKCLPVEKPEQNRALLANWILVYYMSSAFNICPHQPSPEMTGPLLKINTEEGAQPVACHSPIPTPHHWKREVKSLIDNYCRLGVMEPVPAGTPTSWCSRLFATPKANGDPRLVVDLQELNKVSKRETHHTPTPWNLVSSIPKGMKKSVLDAKDGYHSVPLHPSSTHKTTFITEFGRYRYLRAPQGWIGSGDGYTKRFDDFTVDIEDKVRCIDDSALWKIDVEQSFWHVVTYIDTCGRNGVIFNPAKFVFAEETVDFAGFTVTDDSIRPTLKMTKAIEDFPVPTSISGVRSWFGIINQVAYAFSQSTIMAPFRDLLQKNKKFYWDSTLDELFAKSKKDIVRLIEEGVKMFEIARETCLATDWSKTGVGFFLLQKHCLCVSTEKAPYCGPGHWKLIFAGSRFLKDPESRYAPIEGEALAVVFALEQARMFVLGCPNLVLAIDHKPLVPILNDKRLDLIKNPRILNFKEKTMMYKFHAQHIPGALNFAADATSRNPSEEAKSHLLTLIANAEDTNASPTFSDTEELHIAMVNAVRASDDEVISWDRVREASSKDDVCMYLCDAIEKGFPNKKAEAAECLRPYYKMKEELYSLDGVPFLNGRMYIPKVLRREVLATLHSAHQAPAGMKSSARHRFWWLGMDADIEQVRSQCRECNSAAPSNAKEPLTSPPEPEYPWQLSVMDYFEQSNHYYLVIADRYTGWAELYRQNGKVITLIKTCRNLFAQFGIPEEIASDGGGPFSSHEWPQFLKQWAINWRKSSANFPQSNGRAELAVKTCKRLLRNNTGSDGSLDTSKVAKALLQYRNTPIAGIGMSPAYMLFGRQLRDSLPCSPMTWEPVTMSYHEKYGPRSQVWRDIQEAREIAHARKQAKVIERFDVNTKPLTPLSVGDSVSIQNRSGTNPLRWDRTGEVVERLEHRQYLVKADGSGRTLLRNRYHLRKINPSTRDQSAYDISHPAITESSHDNEKQQPLLIPGQLQDGTKIIDPIDPEEELPRSREEIPSAASPIDQPNNPSITENSNDSDATTTTSEKEQEAPPLLRRSTRIRNPPKVLSPTMHGKCHQDVSR